jgi:hypothetical protein
MNYNFLENVALVWLRVDEEFRMKMKVPHQAGQPAPLPPLPDVVRQVEHSRLNRSTGRCVKGLLYRVPDVCPLQCPVVWIECPHALPKRVCLPQVVYGVPGLKHDRRPYPATLLPPPILANKEKSIGLWSTKPMFLTLWSLSMVHNTCVSYSPAWLCYHHPSIVKPLNAVITITFFLSCFSTCTRVKSATHW